MTSSNALCVLAGARLISSASSNCVNTGPRTTRNSRVVGVEHRVPGNVGRHHVGRELHPCVVQRHRLRECTHQQGLAQSRHAFDQCVTRCDERNDDLLHDFVLADHCLADRGSQSFHHFGGPLNRIGFNLHACSPGC